MDVPDIHLRRGRLLLVGTGALPVALLPGWITCLRDWYGWSVRVCLSRAATRLVAADALAALTGHPVLGPEWNTAAGRVDHREAAEWADLVLVVPATGNWIAKAAHGITDSLPLAVTAFTEAPVFVVPSLGSVPARRPATRRNLETLAADGYHVVPTARGLSAHSGRHEEGAMPSVYAVLRAVHRGLAGRHPGRGANETGPGAKSGTDATTEPENDPGTRDVA